MPPAERQKNALRRAGRPVQHGSRRHPEARTFNHERRHVYTAGRDWGTAGLRYSDRAVHHQSPDNTIRCQHGPRTLAARPVQVNGTRNLTPAGLKKKRGRTMGTARTAKSTTGPGRFPCDYSGASYSCAPRGTDSRGTGEREPGDSTSRHHDAKEVPNGTGTAGQKEPEPHCEPP